MNRLLEEQGKLQDAIDAAGGWELERKLEIAADALRLPPWDASVQSLSGGERRRVALCRLLLSNPDMLLLDEPTNHLDAESVAWLERFLKEFPGTVIAVTHDRYFLDNVAGWILELDRGHGIPWQGNYSSWLEQKDQRLKLEEKQEVARQRTIKTELEWVRTNPGARRAKAKARLARFEELTSKEFQDAQRDERDLHSAGPAARRSRHRGRQDRQVVRRPRAVRESVVQPAARRYRRRHRPERRRQDDAVPHHGGTRQARRGHDPHRRHRAARLRRSEPRLA